MSSRARRNYQMFPSILLNMSKSVAVHPEQVKNSSFYSEQVKPVTVHSEHVKTSCRPSITSQNQLPSILDMSKTIVAIHPEHVHPEQVKTPYLPSWTSHNHFPCVLNKTKPLTFNPQQVKTPLPSILNKSKPLSFLPKQVKITYLPSWTGQNQLLFIQNKSNQ